MMQQATFERKIALRSPVLLFACALLFKLALDFRRVLFRSSLTKAQNALLTVAKRNADITSVSDLPAKSDGLSLIHIWNSQFVSKSGPFSVLAAYLLTILF